LTAEDFEYEIHRIIYAAISFLHSNQTPVDLITVSEYLDEHGQSEATGDFTYLTELCQAIPTTTHAVEYIRTLRARTTRSRLSSLLQVNLAATNDGHDTDEILSALSKGMMELQTGKQQSMVTTSDMADALISYMEAPELPTIKTGFHELDLRTGGLRGGELILLAGRPGMGKTSMAQSLALNMANNEHHVVFLECEMPPLDLSMRWISALSKLPLGMIRNKGIRADEDMDKYIRASARFSELQITMLDASGWTVSKIRAEMLKLHKRKPVDALFIDYLQLLQPEKTSGNTNDAVADQSKRLKMLARELDVPIILLSQLNRGVESRDDKRPRLSDLRDSGAIEQDADAVLFLYRGHVYDEEIPPDRAELNVAKLRNGQPGMIPIRWNGTTTSYHNA
jgi:replicative DNA helicase